MAKMRREHWVWAGAAALGLVGAGLLLARPGAADPVFGGSPVTTAPGLWPRALQLVGGRVIATDGFDATRAGLLGYLTASGVGRIGDQSLLNVVTDVTEPNNFYEAQRAGYDTFTPPREWWPRTAALLKMVQWATAGSDGSVEIRNHWRPEPYNSRVQGEPDSAHVDAMALDVDFALRGDRARAERNLKLLQQEHPWLGMGLGIGSRTIHVDILTGKGARPNIWCYDSYSDCSRVFA